MLRDRRFSGFKFRRQHVIEPYIVDFYCNEVRLIVELDGMSHVGQKVQDDRRRAYLQEQGYRMIRVTNDELLEDPESVEKMITQLLSPLPDPEGEGAPELSMKIVMFTKSVKEKSVEELISLAHELGLEGYDLCVRPDYPINPDNADVQLTEAVRTFQRQGLAIPMVTGNFDLLAPDHPTAEPILAAMDAADVRLIKLGYFKFDPLEQDYWKEVDRIRSVFDRWLVLAEKYNVRICYHTHSRGFMGLNAAMLSHLIRGFDPRHIGAYLDPCHMLIDGEAFEFGAAIVKEHLRMIGLKDALLLRQQKRGHGAVNTKWVEAGQGMVDWTAVFSELVRIGFDGPLSIHCEFEVPQDGFMAALHREVEFFNRARAAATA